MRVLLTTAAATAATIIMGVMEKIKEIEAEMARTVSNHIFSYFSVIFLLFDV